MATADSDDARILATKTVTVDPKVNTLTATMTVTEFMQNVPKSTAITFSGTMEKDSAAIVVTPVNCTIKGVKYAPNTEYNEDNPCSFTAESLEKINERFRNITLTTDGTIGVKVKVVVDGGDPTEINITSTAYVPSTVTFTAPTFEDMTFKKDVESDSFDLDFTGTDLKEYDPVTVTVTPENCTMKHDETIIDDTNPYVVTSTSTEDLTSKMTGFTLTPTADEGVKFAVQCTKDDNDTGPVEVIDITVTSEGGADIPPLSPEEGGEQNPSGEEGDEQTPSGDE